MTTRPVMLGSTVGSPSGRHNQKRETVSSPGHRVGPTCNRETLNFPERTLKDFLKPFRLGQEDSHTLEGGIQEGKLSVKSSFAQKGFQNTAHGLCVFMDLRVCGTSRLGHRPTQSGVVKEELCPIQLGPPKSRPHTETQFTTPHSGWPSFQSHMKA